MYTCNHYINTKYSIYETARIIQQLRYITIKHLPFRYVPKQEWPKLRSAALFSKVSLLMTPLGPYFMDPIFDTWQNFGVLVLRPTERKISLTLSKTRQLCLIVELWSNPKFHDLAILKTVQPSALNCQIMPLTKEKSS